MNCALSKFDRTRSNDLLVIASWLMDGAGNDMKKSKWMKNTMFGFESTGRGGNIKSIIEKIDLKEYSFMFKAVKQSRKTSLVNTLFDVGTGQWNNKINPIFLH